MRRIALTVLVAASAATLGGEVARASCGSPLPYEEAFAATPIVFVGTVTAVSNGRRWARVAVDEVWKGPELPAVVEVRAGPKDPPGGGGVGTSVDRYYRVRRRYVFFPYRGASPVFRDDACSRTTVFRPELERLRPASLSETPAPTETADVARDAHDDSSRLSGFRLFMAGLMATLLLLLVAWILKERRANADS